MAIHDWSRAPAGLFHRFHQRWAVSICDDLNAGRMPEGLLRTFATTFASGHSG